MKKISLFICILFLGALFSASAFAGDKAVVGGSAPMTNESAVKTTPPVGAPGDRIQGATGQYGQNETVSPAVPPVGAPGERPYAAEQMNKGAGVVGTASFNLKDKKVITSDGEKFGEVDDVIVGSNGGVRYLVVGHGGVMGIDEKYTPIPWSVVSKAEKDAVYLNVSKDRLAQAPTISKDEIANLGSPEWSKRVHGYYGDMGSARGMEGNVPGMMKEQSGGMMKGN